MFARPPFLNLVVIRSADLDRAEQFYNTLGIMFERHRHGKGPIHLAAAASINDPVFEIYPLREGESGTTSVRLGFSLDGVDTYLESLVRLGGKVITKPADTKWGRRAVIKDLDGHKVELISNPDREVSS